MSGGSQNTVSQQTVPDWLKPYYTSVMQQGQGLEAKGGPQYYPGNQVAPFSPMQSQGLSDIAQTAGGVNPSANAANANAFETSGALLNPEANPYLRGTFNQAADAVRNQVGSEFAGAGSNITNSAPVLSDQLNDLANQMYGGAYQQGVNTMTQASALAPSIQAGTYMPGQELFSAGGSQQQQAQDIINAEMQKYNYTQSLPYNTLSWYSGLLGQNASPFASQSTTGTMHNNPYLTAGGGALAGAAAGAELGSVVPGIGTGIGAGGGALLGGLLGLFGH